MRTHEKARIGRAAAGRAQQGQVLLRHQQRTGECAQVLDGLLQEQLQVAGAIGRGRALLARAVREQQPEVAVELAHDGVEVGDGDMRHQLAAQALERGREQRVREREVLRLLVLRVAGPAHDRDHAQELACVIAHRAEVDGLVAGEQAQLAAAARIGTRATERVVHDVHEIGPGRGLGRPHELAGRPEHRDAGGARQERAHQPRIGLHPEGGRSGRRLVCWGRAHGSVADLARKSGYRRRHHCSYVVVAPCASWRIRRLPATATRKT